MNKYLSLSTLLMDKADPDPEAGGGTGGGQLIDKTDSGEGGMYGVGDGKDDAQGGTDGGEDVSKTGAGDDAENFGDDKGSEDADKGTEGGEDEGAEGAEGDKGADDKTPLLRLDPETIAQLREGLGIKQQAEPEGRQQEQLSPDQIKAMLNPVEVNEQMVAEIRSEDPKVAAAGMLKLQQATVKNAVSIARVLIQKEAAKFEAAMGPLFQQQQEAQLASTKNEFYTMHKDLAKYDKVVKAIASEVDGTGKSKAQIFNEVAKATRATLKTMGINLTTANPGAGGGKPVPKANGIGSSGRSGGDDNGQKGKNNNPDADIYSNARR